MAPTHSRLFTVADADNDACGLFNDPPTGRKTFKMQNAKNGQKCREAVWPPELEKALFRGLIRYHPGTSKDRKTLQRFPRRNKKISEYILKEERKMRTAKQVGSRLQQLRETCTIPWGSCST
ncbi:hypothetical protein NLJ89_g11917 [Agrocybe chaxingu]|uniref:TEA domain-containing protein n=1 Tax=Agrocybe chaxingu TaxID=84603 RepID=A0A9W8JL03_9AGAR|nr:hypothetical protein NLJ89_g11917 [Agrocybe chaxingu]